jgi:hypothetical protein
MDSHTNDAGLRFMKPKLLKIFLLLSGSIQICYWGISHLFFPEWYLRSAGLTALAENPGSTIVFLNEIGILTIGLGTATILASLNPIRNSALIISLYITALGSISVSLYHIQIGTMAAGEWTTVIVIGIQVILLSLLYPWNKLIKSGIINSFRGDK